MHLKPGERSANNYLTVDTKNIAWHATRCTHLNQEMIVDEKYQAWTACLQVLPQQAKGGRPQSDVGFDCQSSLHHLASVGIMGTQATQALQAFKVWRRCCFLLLQTHMIAQRNVLHTHGIHSLIVSTITSLAQHTVYCVAALKISDITDTTLFCSSSPSRNFSSVVKPLHHCSLTNWP